MRSYGKISPRFWNGPTGKRIRALGVEAQLVALYLMSSPSSSMTGLYYLPIPVLSHETGLPFEGASKALRSLAGVHFCAYDPAEEVVWVPEMAKHQVGESLKPADNRVAGIVAALEPYVSSCFYADFLSRYAAAYSLKGRVRSAPPTRGFEAPSEPLRSQDQDQEQEQEQDQEQKVAPPPAPPDVADPADEFCAEGTDPGGRRPKRASKPASGDHATFIAAFDALYAEANGDARPTWGAKQGSQVKALLKAHGLDECRRRAGNMFRAPPSWPPPPHDLGTLAQHFDRFAVPHVASARAPAHSNGGGMSVDEIMDYARRLDAGEAG